MEGDQAGKERAESSQGGANDGEGGRETVRGGMFDSMTMSTMTSSDHQTQNELPGEERIQELKYTTNNKKNTNEGFMTTDQNTLGR